MLQLVDFLARDRFLPTQQPLEQFLFAQDRHPVDQSAGKALVAQVADPLSQTVARFLQTLEAHLQRSDVHGVGFRFVASMGVQKLEQPTQVALPPGMRQILHQFGAAHPFDFVAGLVGVQLAGQAAVYALGGGFRIQRLALGVAAGIGFAATEKSSIASTG